MKSIFREEVPRILSLLDEGIRHRVETTGPDDTVLLLETLREKIGSHQGEHIRVSLGDVDLSTVDRDYLSSLFSVPPESDQNLFQHILSNEWAEDQFESGPPTVDEGE